MADWSRLGLKVREVADQVIGVRTGVDPPERGRQSLARVRGEGGLGERHLRERDRR